LLDRLFAHFAHGFLAFLRLFGLKYPQCSGKRRSAVIDRKRFDRVKLLSEFLLVLMLIALAGLHPAKSWSQAGTYKAPMPKPSGSPAANAMEKTAPSVSEAVKPALDYENEMKKLNSLIASSDKNADAFYNRGWLYEYKGNLEMAEKDYSEAIALDKNHKEAYYNRGLIFVKMGKFEGAIKDFSEVIRLDPKFVDAYCNRGNAYLQLKKPDRSIKDYDTALQLRPNDPDILYNRGVAYLEKGNKPKALDDFKKSAAKGHAQAQECLKTIPKKPK
jgi:tetratricopeptide (TPR) repeat protein